LKGNWNDAVVALKHLRSPEHFSEFEKEANMIKSLIHPNIVQFLGIYTDTMNENV